MIGARIKDYLNTNGIKQSFLAEKSGITVARISDICNKRTKVGAVEYAKICKALGLPLGTFLEGIE